MTEILDASPMPGKLLFLPKPILSIAILLAPVVLSACVTERALPELGTVTGVLKLDGAPLHEAQVKFYPNNGRTSFGMTDRQGRYELNYDREVLGAILGYHTVVISKTLMDDTMGAREVLPDKYSGDSQIRVRVDPGANVFDFDLQTDPATNDFN